MIPHDKFPWLSHRTIAEVAETQTLRRRRAGMSVLEWRNTGSRARLAALEARAAEPPADPEPPEAA